MYHGRLDNQEQCSTVVAKSLLLSAACTVVGQWQDPGIELIPNITTLRGTEEPPFHRVPLEQWDEARGLVSIA